MGGGKCQAGGVRGQAQICGTPQTAKWGPDPDPPKEGQGGWGTKGQFSECQLCPTACHARLSPRPPGGPQQGRPGPRPRGGHRGHGKRQRGRSLWTHLGSPASPGTWEMASEPDGHPPASAGPWDCGSLWLRGGGDEKRQRNRPCGTPEPTDQASREAAARALGGRAPARSHRRPLGEAGQQVVGQLGPGPAPTLFCWAAETRPGASQPQFLYLQPGTLSFPAPGPREHRPRSDKVCWAPRQGSREGSPGSKTAESTPCAGGPVSRPQGATGLASVLLCQPRRGSEPGATYRKRPLGAQPSLRLGTGSGGRKAPAGGGAIAVGQALGLAGPGPGGHPPSAHART